MQSLCCAKSLQSCPSLCDHMDCSPPGSSIHGVLQARILEWVAMPSSRSSWPSDWTTPCLLYLLHWQGSSLPLGPPGKPHAIPLALYKHVLLLWITHTHTHVHTHTHTLLFINGIASYPIIQFLSMDTFPLPSPHLLQHQHPMLPSCHANIPFFFCACMVISH